MNNICLLTDSYKATHHVQYPPGTELVWDGGGLKTVRESEPGGNVLETVFSNGEIERLHTFAEVRDFASSGVIGGKV